MYIFLNEGNLDSTALANYIQDHDPVHPYVEGRLIFVHDVTEYDTIDDNVTCSSDKIVSLQLVILGISTICTLLTRFLIL